MARNLAGGLEDEIGRIPIPGELRGIVRSIRLVSLISDARGNNYYGTVKACGYDDEEWVSTFTLSGVEFQDARMSSVEERIEYCVGAIAKEILQDNRVLVKPMEAMEANAITTFVEKKQKTFLIEHRRRMSTEKL